jgi:acyl-Coa thioesterase superfamily protein/acyl-CoA thioesterase superfamily protein
MSDSVFLAEGERFVPTEHARGPWDQKALHGGAAAGLMTSALERVEPGSDLLIARLGFELLRPIPFAPLSISVRFVRPGRRVQELAGELRHGDELVARASALRVQRIPDGLPGVPRAARDSADMPLTRGPTSEDPDLPTDGRMPAPDAGETVRFALNDADRTSFAASAMEMRWLDDPSQLGPARVWMRLRHPLVRDDAMTPLARLAATADFGNGVSAMLPFDRFLFINADLTIHLQRTPLGEWIGLDARTLLSGGGTGLAESVLHDVHGPVGRAFQTLVVQPR